MALERLSRLEKLCQTADGQAALQRSSPSVLEDDVLRVLRAQIETLVDRVSHLESLSEGEHVWREHTYQRMEQAMESLGQHGEEIRRFSQTFEARCAANGKSQAEVCAELCAGLDELSNLESRVREIVMQQVQDRLGPQSVLDHQGVGES